MNKLASWLNREQESHQFGTPLTDFERLCEELRQGDVLLVEGHSRVSEVIKSITYSPWTHSVLYIGRLVDIKEGALQNKIAEVYNGHPHEQLVVEALLGEGTIVSPVSKYQDKHLRICRPRGLSKQDRHNVIASALSQLGYEYDIRHLLDLARFLLPYSYIPKRWRSTLFRHYAGQQTKNVCSYILGEAFASVSFPILPVAERTGENSYKLYKRNTRLYTPRDFDYSPYFDIIKYPYLDLDDVAAYRALPWDEEGMVCNAQGDCYIPYQKKKAESEPDATGKNDDNDDNVEADEMENYSEKS